VASPVVVAATAGRATSRVELGIAKRTSGFL
jgi:hypothetical protein